MTQSARCPAPRGSEREAAFALIRNERVSAEPMSEGD
jgi:hypothetical protein